MTVAETALSDPVLLDVNGGLDVTMAPDGTLFVAKNGEKKVIYLEPLELEDPNLVVKSVFPRRGLQAGGTRLTSMARTWINSELLP